MTNGLSLWRYTGQVTTLDGLKRGICSAKVRFCLVKTVTGACNDRTV